MRCAERARNSECAIRPFPRSRFSCRTIFSITLETVVEPNTPVVVRSNGGIGVGRRIIIRVQCKLQDIICKLEGRDDIRWAPALTIGNTFLFCSISQSKQSPSCSKLNDAHTEECLDVLQRDSSSRCVHEHRHEDGCLEIRVELSSHTKTEGRIRLFGVLHPDPDLLASCIGSQRTDSLTIFP